MTPFLLLLLAAAPAADTWVAPGPAQQAAPAAPAKPGAADPIAQRLTALELALSATVVQPTERWRFDRLREEARQIENKATRPADRAAAKAISERIERFAAIAKRDARVGEVAGWRRPTGQAKPGERLAPPVQLTKAPARPNAPEAAPTHDAVGVLRPVVSKRPGAPKYAVVDDKGRLAALVTPAPEVADRFEQMLGRRVGLDGQRGYLTDLRREHLTANRLTPLPTIRR